MADRVSASIIIGGTVTPDLWTQLVAHIAAEDLSVEWDGDAFAPNAAIEGEPLRLFSHNVAWGRFEALEQYCCDNRIAYRRWSGGCPGSFGAERIVYDGKTGPLNYDVDKDDHVVVHAHTIAQLGSMRAIRHYLKAAEIEIPVLVLADTADPDATTTTTASSSSKGADNG